MVWGDKPPVCMAACHPLSRFREVLGMRGFALGNNMIIKVMVTEPLGSSCRKLIYDAGVVAEKLGLEMEITSNAGFL